MKAITGRERLVAALRREYTDRVPVTVMFGAISARLAGFTVRDFLTKATTNVEAHLQFYQTFHPDSLSVSADPFLLAEAIGCEMEFPEEGLSYIKRPLLEKKSDLAKLHLPDPHQEKRLPFFLEVCQRLASTAREAGPGAGTCGPLTLATDIRGVQELLYDTGDDPSFVHELMRFATKAIKVWGSAIRATGIGLAMFDPSASCSVISPQIYREFVKPYHQEIIRYFKDRKTLLSLHICGYIDPIMEDVVSTGVGMASLDSPSSLEKMAQVSQKRVILMGNVPTSLFAYGTKEEIETAVKRCIDIAAPGSGYILCSGCEIPLNSRVENIRHYFEAAHRYGTYQRNKEAA